MKTQEESRLTHGLIFLFIRKGASMSGFESDIGPTVAPLVIGTLITWLKPIYAKMARIRIDWKFSEILFEAMLKAWIWCNSWPNEVKKYKMICGCCLRFWKTSPGHMSGYWILISNSETPPLQLGQNWFHRYCSVQSVCDRTGGKISAGQGVIFHLYSCPFRIWILLIIL